MSFSSYRLGLISSLFKIKAVMLMLKYIAELKLLLIFTCPWCLSGLAQCVGYYSPEEWSGRGNKKKLIVGGCGDSPAKLISLIR